jgi:hypothetical protein
MTTHCDGQRPAFKFKVCSPSSPRATGRRRGRDAARLLAQASNQEQDGGDEGGECEQD